MHRIPEGYGYLNTKNADRIATFNFILKYINAHSLKKGQMSRSPDRFTDRRVGASGSCSGGRGNVLAVGNCWLRCRLLGGAKRFGAHGGRRGAGHIVAAAHLHLVHFVLLLVVSTERCCWILKGLNFTSFDLIDLKLIYRWWRFGVAVTRWSWSTQLLYIEPG